MVSCPGLLAFALVAVANSRKISPKELQRREQRKREREGLRGPAAEQALQDTARTQASPALRLETQRAELEERLAELETQGAALAAETARVEHGLADVLEALDRANGTDAAAAPPPAAAPAACAAPPAGGNATVVRFGAVDESGLRVAGRGWGRVLAKWRCAKRMKIAVLGGSMTCGGNLAKSDKDKKGKAWPSQLLAKLRSSLGAGVSLHNACVPASSLGWCVSLLSTRVLAGTDVVVVDYSQNDNRPTIEDAREGGAAVDASVRRVAEAFLVALAKLAKSRREPPPAVLFLTTILPPKFHMPTTKPAFEDWRALWADPERAAAYAAVLRGHARVYDRVATFHGASSCCRTATASGPTPTSSGTRASPSSGARRPPRAATSTTTRAPPRTRSSPTRQKPIRVLFPAGIRCIMVFGLSRDREITVRGPKNVRGKNFHNRLRL